MSDKPCPGGGRSWTVDKAGKPICPRCFRALATVAGKGRSISNTPKVPVHVRLRDKPQKDAKPGRQA